MNLRTRKERLDLSGDKKKFVQSTIITIQIETMVKTFSDEPEEARDMIVDYLEPFIQPLKNEFPTVSVSVEADVITG